MTAREISSTPATLMYVRFLAHTHKHTCTNYLHTHICIQQHTLTHTLTHSQGYKFRNKFIATQGMLGMCTISWVSEYVMQCVA